MTPADTQYFGGKAANYGFLRRAIPDDSYEAIAFSFDLWDALYGPNVAQWSDTSQRDCRADEWQNQFPPDIPALRADLAAIRTLITTVASFNSAQRQIVLAALAPFDPSRKIRFREFDQR